MSVDAILVNQKTTAEIDGVATAEALEIVASDVINIDSNTEINNTASSQGSLSQKLSYIIDQLNTLSSINIPRSTVKSVQRGTLTFSGETATATINAVDVNKSIVIHGGSSWLGTGGTSGDYATYSGLWDVRLMLTDSTTVTATVGYYQPAYTGPTTWQVIEFY